VTKRRGTEPDTPTRAHARRPAGAWREPFLLELTKLGVVKYAAEACGVSRSTVYETRGNDEEFARRMDDAVDEAVDVLEREAIRRAHEGVEEPLVSAGRLVLDADGQPLTVRRYSDRLLELLLKSKRPKVFSDRTRHQVELDATVRPAGITLARLHEMAAAAAAEDDSDGS
jgi:hypothetical protein